MTTLTRGATPLDVAMPAGAAAGGVIVIQEAFGVNAHVRDIAQRVAGAGYIAVAPHLFWRQGDPIFAYDGAMDDVMKVMGTLRDSDIATDVDAAVDELAARGVDARHIAIIGFCMGGTVAFSTAARRRLGAAVTFYGGGVSQGRFGYPPLLELAPALRTPWLGLYGDADQGIPIDDVEALRRAARTSGVATDVVRYPDAGHGFNCDARASYHAASARDAWERMLEWLEHHVRGS